MLAPVANQQEHIFKGELSSSVSWHPLQYQHRVLREERKEFETNYVQYVSKGAGQFLLIPLMAVWATVAGLGNSLGKVDYLEC